MTTKNRLGWAAASVLLVAAGLSANGCGSGEAAPAKDESAQAAEPEDGSSSAEAGSAEDPAGAETASKDADKSNGKGKGKGKGKDEKKEEAVPVEVVELRRGPIEAVLRFSSTLEVESQVTVHSQAKRLVRELRVEEGDHVRRGDVLVRLDDEEQRSALARVESQLAQAAREYERQTLLHDQALVSDQTFADARFEAERLRIALGDAERELGYTEVRAPVSGTITRRMVNLGDQVQIEQALFEIMDFDTMVARVFVPEKHLAHLDPGLEARVSAAATGSRRFVGHVQRIAPVVDPQTGTVKVTVAIGPQIGLRPGLYVDVDLVMALHADAVRVPKRAVVYDRDQMFVYRLGQEQQRVERVYIEPALSDKEFVEPVGGLDVGDQVVSAGQAGLKDGALVQLPGAEPPPTATAEADASVVASAAQGSDS